MVYRGQYEYASLLFSQTFFRIISVCWEILQKFLKGMSDAYKWLICIMQRVHFQVRVGVFNCQQILAKISFVIFDLVIKKQIECGLAWYWWNSTDLRLIDMVLINLNAEIVACILSFRKSRHKPNLENTSKYGFSPDLGEKMAAFWACACKLSWTLLSLARVQPLYGAGRKESSGTGLKLYKSKHYRKDHKRPTCMQWAADT